MWPSSQAKPQSSLFGANLAAPQLAKSMTSLEGGLTFPKLGGLGTPKDFASILSQKGGLNDEEQVERNKGLDSLVLGDDHPLDG